MATITKKQKQEMNLAVLIEEYRNKGRALKGYNKLSKAISGGKDLYLKRMLRNHSEKPIDKQSEVDFRDEIDFLLKFYSLLEIAILTDYVPSMLNLKLKFEIITILGNEYVSRYYRDYYSLLLPEILFTMLKAEKKQKNVGDSNHFVELLLLEKNIDDDVENFLWLLDDGWFGTFDIDSLRKTLTNRTKVSAILSKPRKAETNADSAFWGFIKFTDYMQRYEQLLKNCENELLRSMLWYYQSYWFYKMEALMNRVYVPAIKDINKLNNSLNYNQFLKNKTTLQVNKTSKSQLNKQNRNVYANWKKQSDIQVKSAISSVKYNLNKAHGNAFKAYYKIEVF